MRRAALLTASLLLVALAAAARPPAVHACSCAPGTEAEYTDHADVVFDGVARSVREVPGPVSNGAQGPGRDVWTFGVDRVVKGSATNPQDVSTSGDGASCGTSFAVGQAYRVFTTRVDDGGLQTGLCSGNRELAAAASTTSTPRTSTTPTLASTTTTIESTTSTAQADPTPTGNVAIRTADEDSGNGPLVAAGVLAAAALAGTGYALYRRRSG